MQLFDCGVRPGGFIILEVPKKNLTAAEIVLLRSIHGQDSVVNIKKGLFIPKDKLSTKQVRAKLVQTYGAKLVDAAFGKFNDVPTELPDITYEEPEDEDLGAEAA
jgi:hypothetical protein